MVRRDVVRLLSCATDLAASDGLREPGRAPSRRDGGLTEGVGKGRHGTLGCEWGRGQSRKASGDRTKGTQDVSLRSLGGREARRGTNLVGDVDV